MIKKGEELAWLFRIIGVSLCGFALLKLITVVSGNVALGEIEPISGATMYQFLLAIGIGELLVGGLLLLSPLALHSHFALNITACTMMIYRVRLEEAGGLNTCPCLGAFRGVLPLSAQALDQILLFIAIFYWMISVNILFRHVIPQATNGVRSLSQ